MLRLLPLYRTVLQLSPAQIKVGTGIDLSQDADLRGFLKNNPRVAIVKNDLQYKVPETPRFTCP